MPIIPLVWQVWEIKTSMSFGSDKGSVLILASIPSCTLCIRILEPGAALWFPAWVLRNWHHYNFLPQESHLGCVPLQSFLSPNCLQLMWHSFWKLTKGTLLLVAQLPNLHWVFLQTALWPSHLYHRPKRVFPTNIQPSTYQLCSFSSPNLSSFPDGSGRPRSALTSNSNVALTSKNPRGCFVV